MKHFVLIKVKLIHQLLFNLFNVGSWQLDLVEHRDDVQACVEGVVEVGDRLRLDAFRCIDNQNRAFASSDRPTDLVTKVHMTLQK